MVHMYLAMLVFSAELYLGFVSIGLSKGTALLFACAGFMAILSICAAVKCGIESAKK